MNPVAAKIEERLMRFPKPYGALRDHALRYLAYCSALDTDGAALIGHMPWVAPLAYAITIFLPAKKSWLDNFKRNNGKKIPKIHGDFLLVANGGFAYSLSLFGLAPSMQKSLGLLNRETLECHDLSFANDDWIKEYEVEDNIFHFGSRAFSEHENLGYFIGVDNVIRGLRKNGDVVGEWTSFANFLSDELEVAERMMHNESQDERAARVFSEVRKWFAEDREISATASD
jgi:hypothetical protein